MRDRRGAWAAKSCGALAVSWSWSAWRWCRHGHSSNSNNSRGRAEGAGPVRDQGGVPLPKDKAKPNAADPLGKAVAAGPLVPGTYHFNFRLHSFDGAPLAASYYRSKLGSTAPVVMLIHESGRSRKDFEDAMLELKGQGLAEHLQGLDYAVLSLDLRGQGQNLRRALSPRRTQPRSSRTSRPPTSSWSTATTAAS